MHQEVTWTLVREEGPLEIRIAIEGPIVAPGGEEFAGSATVEGRKYLLPRHFLLYAGAVKDYLATALADLPASPSRAFQDRDTQGIRQDGVTTILFHEYLGPLRIQIKILWAASPLHGNHLLPRETDLMYMRARARDLREQVRELASQIRAKGEG